MPKDIYYPEVIPDAPFPMGDIEIINESQQTSNGNYSTTERKEFKLPKKRISTELLSTAINTRSRKILESFELQQSGGFQIGNYQDGQTGDIKITPDGLVARNSSGLTTLLLDGDTGDAIFAGELRTGSTITGSVEVTDGYIALYNDGILQIFIGDDGE